MPNTNFTLTCSTCGYVEDGQHKPWTLTIEGKWQCDDCWQILHPASSPEMTCIRMDCIGCPGEQICMKSMY